MIYSENSFLLLLAGTLLAALLAWYAYRNLPIQTDSKNTTWINILAGSCRFIALLVLAWLLIGLVFKQSNNQTQKPILVLAIDNSASLALGNKTKPQVIIENLKQQLRQKVTSKFEVVEVTLGKKTQLNSHIDFSEKQTNLADLFDWCSNQFPKQNIGAVVMASDGIYNLGQNPTDVVDDLQAPIYSVAFGDTTTNPDISITAVRHNKTVFKNNVYRVEVDVKTKNLPLTTATVRLTQNGRVVQSKAVAINGFNTVGFDVTALKPPLDNLVIEVAIAAKEKNTQNNRWEGYVDVEDGAKKIALFAYSPHPDLAAIQSIFENNEKFKLHQYLFTQPKNYTLTDYHLVILHQLPALNGEGFNIVKACKAANIPILYVVGSLTGLSYLNQVESAFKCTYNPNGINQAQPYYAAAFTAFNIETNSQAAYNDLPPLAAPFGTYVLKEEGQVLLYQQLGFVKTDYPLLFLAGSTNKVGVIGGEGIWKWRLHEAKTGNAGLTETTILGMVQFLVNTNSADKLRINHAQIFNEDDEVILHGELFNETMQLTNIPELMLELVDAKNKRFSYVFNKVENQYKLNLNNLYPGQFTYTAKAVLGKTTYIKKGAFVVNKLFAELADTKANHQLLKQLSAQTNGEFFDVNHTGRLVDVIMQNNQIKPIVYTQTQFMQLIDWRWLLFVLLVFLTAEWVIRKWFGLT